MAHNMTRLYSLDLSLCTNVSIDALVYLLEKSCKSLCELRLYNCCQIDLTLPAAKDRGPDMSPAGRRILDAIHLHGTCGALCLLDVRGCVGTHPREKMRTLDDSFVQGMKTMGFKQSLPNFFERPIQWTEEMRQEFHSYLMEVL
jgi:hypothetical protein